LKILNIKRQKGYTVCAILPPFLPMMLPLLLLLFSFPVHMHFSPKKGRWHTAFQPDLQHRSLRRSFSAQASMFTFGQTRLGGAQDVAFCLSQDAYQIGIREKSRLSWPRTGGTAWPDSGDV
jgi:hypothetical protein